MEEWSSLALLRIHIQQHKLFCSSTQKMWEKAGEAFPSLLNLNGKEDNIAAPAQHLTPT